MRSALLSWRRSWHPLLAPVAPLADARAVEQDALPAVVVDAEPHLHLRRRMRRHQPMERHQPMHLLRHRQVMRPRMPVARHAPAEQVAGAVGVGVAAMPHR